MLALVLLVAVALAAPADDLASLQEAVNRYHLTTEAAITQHEAERRALVRHVPAMVHELRSRFTSDHEHLMRSVDALARKRTPGSAGCLAAVQNITGTAAFTNCVTLARSALCFDSTCTDTTRAAAQTQFCGTCIAPLQAAFAFVMSECRYSDTDNLSQAATADVVAAVRRLGAGLRIMCDGAQCLSRVWSAVARLSAGTALASADLDVFCAPCVYRVIKALGAQAADPGMTSSVASPLPSLASRAVGNTLRALCRRHKGAYCMLSLQSAGDQIKNIVAGLQANPTLDQVRSTLNQIMGVLCQPCVTKIIRAFVMASGGNNTDVAGGLGGALTSFLLPVCRKDGGDYCVTKIFTNAVVAAQALQVASATATPPCQTTCDPICQALKTAVVNIGCCWTSVIEFASPFIVRVNPNANVVANFLSCAGSAPASCPGCDHTFRVKGNFSNVYCTSANAGVQPAVRGALCGHLNGCFGAVTGCAAFQASCSGGVLSVDATGGYCLSDDTDIDSIVDCVSAPSDLDQALLSNDNLTPQTVSVDRSVSGSGAFLSAAAALLVGLVLALAF